MAGLDDRTHHTPMRPEPDSLRRFVLEGSAVRGELVRLDSAWRTLLAGQAYPTPVRTVLGEAVAAAALLAATIKFDGSLRLQFSGDGPLGLLLAEATGDRTVRGLARCSGPVATTALPGLVGEGRLHITIDPGEGGERYQSVVALAGETVAETLEDYFERSEQLPTRLWLAVDAERAAGLLLQHLPPARGMATEPEDADTWDRSTLLADTLTPAELLDLDPARLLHRLYHEEDVRLFSSERVLFGCRCSREKVVEMLRGLGPDEVRDIVAEQGSVSVRCEFCNAGYEFDAVDAELLFASVDPQAAGSTRH
jgi:molecular chaperone Hsp33